MSARAGRRWTAVHGALVASLFALAFGLSGITVTEAAVEYRLFGLVDGLAGLVLVYVLVDAEVLSWPNGGWGAVVLGYGAAATCQLVALLLPPPGVLEWFALLTLVLLAWSAGYHVHRERLVLVLGLLALALAVLKYSVLPFVWSRAQLPETPVLDLRELGERFKALFVTYSPSRPVTQVFAFGAIVTWSLAVWLQWPPESPRGWLRRLSRGERDRLLSTLIRERSSESEALGSAELAGYLDPGKEPE